LYCRHVCGENCRKRAVQRYFLSCVSPVHMGAFEIRSPDRLSWSDIDDNRGQYSRYDKPSERVCILSEVSVWDEDL